MAIREGRWDCPSCGRRGVLGRDLACPGCGDVRPEGIRFYLPEDAPEVFEHDRLAEARSGPDWICDYCEASNRAGRTHCERCGAERDSARQQQVRLVPSYKKIADAAVRRSRAASVRLTRVPMIALVLLSVVASLLVWGCVRTYEVEAVVSGVQWERTLRIEELRTEREEDWSVPPGGRLLGSRQAVHHHDQVLDHYETRTRTVSVPAGTRQVRSGSRDLGNGYFEDVYTTETVYETKQETYQEPVYRSVPVYATKYEYEIDRWRFLRDVTARGRDFRPHWPSYRPAAKEREAGRTETYTVEFRAGDESYVRKVPPDQFAGHRPGRRATLGVSFFGKVRWVRLYAEEPAGDDAAAIGPTPRGATFAAWWTPRRCGGSGRTAACAA
jgi:hypothetical protein